MVEESCSNWLLPGFLPPSSSHGTLKRQLQRSQWVMLWSKCTLSTTNGMRGTWSWKPVSERSSYCTVASLCLPPVTAPGLTPQSFCSVVTRGGNELHTEDVLNTKQCLWIWSCKTHFLKKFPILWCLVSKHGGVQNHETPQYIKEGARPHRNGSDAMFTFALEGNTVHMLSGNKRTQSN